MFKRNFLRLSFVIYIGKTPKITVLRLYLFHVDRNCPLQTCPFIRYCNLQAFLTVLLAINFFLFSARASDVIELTSIFFCL